MSRVHGVGQVSQVRGAQLIHQRALRLTLAPERKENVEENLGEGCQILSSVNSARARADARDRMSSTKAAVMIASLPASLTHGATNPRSHADEQLPREKEKAFRHHQFTASSRCY